MEQKKRDYYGNKIYPIVAQHHPDLAGKITGMILGTGVTEFNEKLDNESYLQNLCENPDFMKVQIKEAISILKNHNLLKSVRISVRNKFKKLIFRRINYMQSFSPRHFLTSPFSPPTPYNGSFHSKLWKQYGNEKNDDFCGFTSHFSLRESDMYKGKQMPFSKQGYAILDPITFEMVPTECFITPRTGDLICGIVDTDNEEPFFDKWFVCSEQFYRCYTLCMFKNHASFKNVRERKDPQQYWMSGNRLMTNSHLKWRLSLAEHNLPCDPVENIQKYWCLRTEPMSINWIHIYCAVVYLVRYNEFLSSENVPINKGGLTYSTWHLPENWANDFVKFHS